MPQPPPPVYKLSSDRGPGRSRTGPGHAGHSCCPSLPVGPPAPAPRGLCCSTLGPVSAVAAGQLSVAPHSLPRGSWGYGWPAVSLSCPEEPWGRLQQGSAGSRRSCTCPERTPGASRRPGPLAPGPRSRSQKNFLAKLPPWCAHRRAVSASAPRGPTGLAGPPWRAPLGKAVPGGRAGVSSEAELGGQGAKRAQAGPKAQCPEEGPSAEGQPEPRARLCKRAEVCGLLGASPSGSALLPVLGLAPRLVHTSSPVLPAPNSRD